MTTNVYDLPDVRQQIGQPAADEEEQVRPTDPTAEAQRVFTAIHRDPADVKLIFSMSISLILFAMGLITSVGLNLYQHLKVPDRVVVTVDKATGSVLEIDNRNFGSTEGVSLSPDRPGKSDKQYLASRFCESFYGIDPKTRPQDVERALRMMTPQAAKALVEVMAKTGELERQRAENWQAVWKAQSMAADQQDNYKINVVGTQEITKLKGDATQQQTRQLIFSLKLVADPRGRADRNQNSGFLVADILDFKEIPAAATSPQSKLAAATAQ